MVVFRVTTAAARPAPTRCGRFARLVNG
jgi:hypothetical protein